MQHPPADLPDATVAGLVVAAWGLEVVDVAHLPVGYGSHHWRLTGADGVPWFVTADEPGGAEGLATLEGALTVAAVARSAGIRGAHASVASTAGPVAVPLGERYAVSVQPWLDGAAGRFDDHVDDPDARGPRRPARGAARHPARSHARDRRGPSVPGRAALEDVLDAVRDGRVPHVSGPLGPVVLDALRRRGPALRRALDASTPHRPPRRASCPPTASLTPGTSCAPPTGRCSSTGRPPGWPSPSGTCGSSRVAPTSTSRGSTPSSPDDPVDAGRFDSRARRWALTDVADFVPTLLAAPVETPDTAWQVDALLGTLDEL